MAVTYCGKSCEECRYRAELNCPGCQSGPGSSWRGECEVAKCCRDKGHETCATCTHSSACSKYPRRETMPQYHLQRRQIREAAQQKRAQTAAKLGKWMWLLFLVAIPHTIVGIYAAFIDTASPADLFDILCGFVGTFFLYKLADENDRYRLVAGLSFAYIVINCLEFASPSLSESDLLSLLTLPISMVGAYHEFTAHSELLSPFDSELSQKWKNFWKAYLWIMISTFVIGVFLSAAPGLGIVATLVVLIFAGALDVLELIYLYRSAMVFKSYSAK